MGGAQTKGKKSGGWASQAIRGLAGELESFDLADDTRSGTLNYREFVVGMAMMLNGQEEEMLRLAFEFYDHSGTGFINQGELKNIILSSNKVAEGLLGDSYSEEDVDTAVAALLEKA